MATRRVGRALAPGLGTRGLAQDNTARTDEAEARQLAQELSILILVVLESTRHRRSFVVVIHHRWSFGIYTER